MDDFPAAHSMDTTWFAVDEAGHLGMFGSGENGHVPDLAEIDDLARVLWSRLHANQAEEDFWELEEEEIAAQLGLFYFAYGDEYDPIGSYELLTTPESPLHIDQLPPELRTRWKRLRFKVDFTKIEELQPLEQETCSYWSMEHRVAYLCSDGKTIRPIPGMEHRFAEFREQFRKENPQVAEKFIFEG